jgi:energy-coupling factor transport system permease protein
VQRTRYRPDHWHAAELAVAASGIAVAVGFIGVLRGQWVLLHPPLDELPTVTTTSLLLVLVGALAAFVSPAPALTQVPGRSWEVDDARAA